MATFTPETAGYSIPIGREKQGGEGPSHGLWRQYGKPIPVQAHIIFTSGTSALVQGPTQDAMDAANTGSGKGDKMIYPTPGGPYTITTAEATVITNDGTYAEFLG